jgi:hypothetical protein
MAPTMIVAQTGIRVNGSQSQMKPSARSARITIATTTKKVTERASTGVRIARAVSAVPGDRPLPPLRRQVLSGQDHGGENDHHRDREADDVQGLD